MSYSVPDAPTDLIIYPPSGSCDELVITWTAPANTGGLPVKYKLLLNEYEEILGNNIDKLHIMNNLTANTEYTVTVVAINELGDGENVTGTGLTRPEGLCYNRIICDMLLLMK